LRLNLLFFTPRYFPAISGGEFYIQSIAEYMKKLYKDNPLILCSNAIDFKAFKSNKGLFIKPEDPNFKSYRGIKLHRIQINHENYKNPIKFNSAINEIKNFCEKINLNLTMEMITEFFSNGPDFNNFIKKIMDGKVKLIAHLIHTTFLPYSPLLYSLIISKLYNIPSICTPFYHIFNPRYTSQHLIGLLANFDAIIACTQYEKNELIKKGIDSKKIHVVPMGVDYTLYANPIKSKTGKIKSFKKFYNIKEDFILFCGYKNYEKGAISLLKSIQKIIKKLPNLLYVFIGPSTLAFDYELKNARKIGAKIINITPDQLNGYYDWRKISAFKECSIFVMPSRTDAYGIVYLEAWAAGKPVIGAKNPVMSEVIKDNYDGILVEFDNTEEIANAIISLMKDRQMRNFLGENGRKKVKNNNQWDLIAKKTRKIYIQNLNHVIKQN